MATQLRTKIELDKITFHCLVESQAVPSKVFIESCAWLIFDSYAPNAHILFGVLLEEANKILGPHFAILANSPARKRLKLELRLGNDTVFAFDYLEHTCKKLGKSKHF